MADTGTPFDDADPEDAWDVSDPARYLIDNIAARLRRLVDDPARLARLLDDLETIRERVIAGENV